jgi:hypothetical protein
MFVRMARFEGADAAGIDAELDSMRQQLGDAAGLPPGLRAVKRVVVLADRDAGTAVDLTFCETEDDLRAADDALDAMSPVSGGSGRRVSVELFEVALDTVPGAS